MNKLEETVTVTREVPRPIADLVFFVKFLRERAASRYVNGIQSMNDEELLVAARDYWAYAHGEDD
jgi:hypothetical protein